MHGGFTPGSAGCVDLVDQMDGRTGFGKWFRDNGKDVVLVVKY